MAKDYTDKHVQDWNVNDFIAYADAKHQEYHGLPMAPMRSWAAERGLVGTIVGTKSKRGKHDKEVVRRFIEYTFRNYRPTKQYPTTSVMFLYTYRQQDLVRIEAEYKQEKKDAEAQAKQSEGIDNEILEWFGS